MNQKIKDQQILEKIATLLPIALPLYALVPLEQSHQRVGHSWDDFGNAYAAAQKIAKSERHLIDRA
jgi:hypothetical protein